MSRVVRTVIGLALIAVSALAICWAIYNLVRIGSCASGGPYVIAQPCPPGTGIKVLALVGGIFGLLIGAAISPLRGSAGVAWGLGFTLIGVGALVAAVGPAHPPGGPGLTIFGWVFGGFMILMGVLGLIGGLMLSRGVQVARQKMVEVASPAGVSVVSGSPVVTVEGGTLTAEQAERVGDSLRSMGMGDLAGFVEDAVEAQGKGTASPGAGAPAGGSADDLTDELAKLADLHASGALTDAEFQRAKQRLLGT